jgi:YD repeat-containing protein
VFSGGDVSGLPASAGYTSGGGHAVTVTGFDYDDAGNLTHVHYNDTNSMCGSRITAAQFQNFMDAESSAFIANGNTPFGSVITNNPIW